MNIHSKTHKSINPLSNKRKQPQTQRTLPHRPFYDQPKVPQHQTDCTSFTRTELPRTIATPRNGTKTDPQSC